MVNGVKRQLKPGGNVTEAMLDFDQEHGVSEAMISEFKKDSSYYDNFAASDKSRAADHNLTPGDTCPICLEDFGGRLACTKLPCGHGVHTSCYQALRENTTWNCPMCRDTYHADMLAAHKPSSVSFSDLWSGARIEVSEKDTSTRAVVTRIINFKEDLQAKVNAGEITKQAGEANIRNYFAGLLDKLPPSSVRDLKKFRDLTEKLDGGASGLFTLSNPPQLMKITPELYKQMAAKGFLGPNGEINPLTKEQQAQLDLPKSQYVTREEGAAIQRQMEEVSAQAGRRARIKGLVKQPQLNGVFCNLERYEVGPGRWVVVLGNGNKMKLKPENLELNENDNPKPRNKSLAAPGFDLDMD